VIEAHYLFGAEYDDIEIVVHPQSIIHSMVETQVYIFSWVPNIFILHSIPFFICFPFLQFSIRFGRLSHLLY
jgi:hypothetical protein